MSTDSASKGANNIDFINHTSFTISVILVSFLTIVFAVLSRFSFPVNPEILATHIELFLLQSTKYQRLSYLIIIGLSAAVSIFLVVSNRQGLLFNAIQNFGKPLLLIAITTSLILLTTWNSDILKYITAVLVLHLALLPHHVFSFRQQGPHFATLKSYVPQLICRLRQISLLFVLTSLLFLWLIPLASPHTIGDLRTLISIDFHYASTILSGADLAYAGTVPRSNYGMGMPVFTAALLKLVQFLNMPDGNLVFVVKFYQLSAIAIALAILFILDRRSWLLWGATLILVTGWTLSNLGASIGFPNQTGIRFMPILVMLAIVVLCMKWLYHRLFPLFLGFLGGCAIWFNPETGIAFAAGCAVALACASYSKHTSNARTIVNISTYFIFVVVTFALFATAAFTIFSMSVSGNPDDPTTFSNMITSFGLKGYGGMRSELSLTAAVFLLCGLGAVFRCVLKVRSGPALLPADAHQLVLAVTLVLWIFYYVNRMAEWNLWFGWVLFIMLISSVFQDQKLDKFMQIGARIFFSSQSTAERLIVVLAFAAFINQMTFASRASARQLWSYYNQVTLCSSSALHVAGFCISEDPANIVTQYLTDLARFPPDKTVVLTELPSITRLAGYNAQVGFYSPWDARSAREVQFLRRQILNFEPHYIVWPSSSQQLGSSNGSLFDRQVHALLNEIGVGSSDNYNSLEVLMMKPKMIP